MSRAEVRPAIEVDIPQLAVLFREQAEYQQELSPYFQLKPDADWSAFVSSKIWQSSSAIFIYEHEAAIVGYISLRVMQQDAGSGRAGLRAWLNLFRKNARRSAPVTVFKPRRYGFVEDLFVIADLRRQGIGRLLWEVGCEWFERMNVKEIDTTIWTNNEQSALAFRHLGFRPLRVMMRKELP